MAKVILKGGEVWNHKDYPKFVEFVKNNVFHCFSKEHKCGDKLNDEEAEKAALDIYVWCQDKKNKNAPKITDSDIWNAVNELPYSD